MSTLTAVYSYNIPEVGGDTNVWGTLLNANWNALEAYQITSDAAIATNVASIIATDLTVSNLAASLPSAYASFAQGTVADAALPRAGGTLTGALTLGGTLDMGAFGLNQAFGANISSATVLTFGTDGDSVYIDLGVSPVTSVAEVKVGKRMHCTLNDTVVFENSASLVCETAGDITGVTGDTFDLVQIGTGPVVWQLERYHRKSGKALAASGTTLKAILTDEKTSGTNGPAPTANTWTKRTLNTEVYDPDGIVSIVSNEFIPTIAGYAKVHFSARDLFTGRLYNVTDSAVVNQGNVIRTAGGEVDTCHITGALIAGKTYRVDIMQSSSNVALANGFSGVVENYMTVEIYA